MKNNRIAAIVIFIFAIYFYYLSLSIKYLPSIIFPRIILIFLAFLSILLFLNVGRVVSDKESSEDFFINIHYSKLLFTILSTITYVKLIELIGFYTLTFIYLIWMIYYFGFRKKKLFLIVPVVAIIIIYGIFKIWLKIPTPKGIFI